MSPPHAPPDLSQIFDLHAWWPAGSLPVNGLIATVLFALTQYGSVLVVKTMIRERGVAASWVWHVALLLLAAVPAGRSPYLIAMTVLLLARAVALPGYTAHNLEARGDRHYRGVCQLYCFWLHYCGDLATLQRFHGAVIPSWGGNWPMGRTVKFYLPQNRAVFVHRPMGFSPPHEWVTAPWRYLLAATPRLVATAGASSRQPPAISARRLPQWRPRPRARCAACGLPPGRRRSRHRRRCPSCR
ncbi:protein [Bifidobacterium longum subsp. infantis]|uniref:Uncharacterized protein n=1 Tax=Bifidobacterium longum subsp. infantis TaxID=1682 RepID=A0ABP1X8Y9_BIFLI|nr:hypothetical protein BLIC_a02403 [Bifidobacterium longum subsp. infantis]CEF05486.1 hypothetical protein BLIC_b02455 [Bifidobacterium longum subsp. infantis]CEF06549.1 hypothetical protein BLIC_c02407 [Bifidobacterium longum subsp. infantis]CEF11321.1 hypothetical protein BLIC_e02425 [Bifidobacterium longum subsp. infantis]CEF13700.1 hypothetical protein BLIC_g02399 [Bifidobacterium longum subsp. infantis]